MITSILFGLCFVILATRPDAGAKIMAGLCLAYLVLENLIFWFFSGAEFFDITLYFTTAWALDSILLFTVALFVRGYRQIAILAMALPLMLVQVFAIQYPILFPDWIYSFAVQDAHRYFIEVFIFVYSWKDNTVSEWLRTGTVLALVIVAHLV
ncbi:hypothetical protein [Enterobacter hormaechei]|nr:putative membrane protein [Klebsiella phage vB_KaeM_KaOmega]UNA02626.1 hypothetical protein [Enterobacter phage vB_ExiM_F1M1E]UNA02946.1 hypothetical protein [Enterobacter phage vB_ExiM_F2M1E]UNA03267.1 hypothetical protein [Enterobacter phage vB_ExiM_F4M1E]UNA03587.1 hypothetical protein [Enterobacter phage vB_ExiM_F5M1E]UNA03908.1 hypothetical protein [Pantoea phage vB_PdiM_F5M2A]